MHEVGDAESSEALYDLDVGCGRSYLYWRGWRQWFQLVWPRCSKQRDLQASIERCEVGTLVLWFVVVHSGGGSSADGQNNAGTRDGGDDEIAAAVAGVGAESADGGVRVDDVGNAV